MQAAILRGPGHLDVTTIEAPAADGRVLVAPRTAGICGTDLKLFTGAAPVGYPLVLGHEAVGEVIDPGNSPRFVAGDRVLIDPSVSCGVCRRCRRGIPHLCGHGGLMGRDLAGVFAERVAVDDRQLLPLPADQPHETGPLLQILGTCVHGQSLVRAEPGQVGVVIGLGVSGLLQVQLLRARGVETVVGITRSASKLALAEQLGASHTVTPAGAAALVAELTAGEGADLVVESSGALPGLQLAVEVAGHAATVLIFGTISATEGAFPYYQLYAKELDLVSSRAAVPGDYAEAIDHVSAGSIRLEPILSRTYPLDRAPDAIEAFRSEPGVLKVTLDVG